MTLDKLKAGMTVYDVHSYQMGNTTMRTIGVWEVFIIEVNECDDQVRASWNSNSSRLYDRCTWSKWRLKKPVIIENSFGRKRIATREEIKALKGK